MVTMHQIVGTCSICGGQVTVPSVWHSIIPPEPTCQSCGAVAASHGPVISMVKPAPRSSTGMRNALLRPEDIERIMASYRGAGE